MGGLAVGPAGGHSGRVPDVHNGHLLPLRLAVPPSEAGHPALEEPEEEDQGEEQTGIFTIHIYFLI